ncbi:hypothetical protein DPMN_084684 [Dreissena polymorpha]|uniref:Uncharacterized protein n=1 Tax=Dreissena polymorpha TaxID=45954 RepID=A0A9D4BIR2_DREPO|nr:hypothetical protein DPMN_084684 [Dreissena polymorpha]
MAVCVWKMERTTRVYARVGGMARTVNASSVPGLDIATTVEPVSQHLPIPTIRAAIVLQDGKEKVAISLTASVDRIAPMAVVVWKTELTTRVYARMGGQERTVNSSSVPGPDIATTVELVVQHLPIPTIRAAIVLQGGKEKVAISLVRNERCKNDC